MIIGPSIYSKDPGIRPEGIALTLPVQFFQEREMTTERFKQVFERQMSFDHSVWNFRLKNLPTMECPYVYILFAGFFQYRCNFMMYERDKAKKFVDGDSDRIRHFAASNWVLFTAPVVKAPEGYVQKGFQGFRYTTFLF